MNLNLYQRYYVTCLIKDKQVINYIDIVDKFNTKFKGIKFLLTECNIRKIKNAIIRSITNYTIEDLCLSLKTIIKEIQVDIYPPKVFIKNKNN